MSGHGYYLSLLIKARSGCLLRLEVDLVYAGSVLESELQQKWRYVYVIAWFAVVFGINSTSNANTGLRIASYPDPL